MPTTAIIPYLFYRDVPAALAWLSRAFGLREEMRVGTPSGGIHAEMSLDGCRIMMGQGGGDARLRPPGEAGPASQGVFLYLPEIDAHFARAEAAGAEIVSPLADLPYGRSYSARDPEGHPWYFTQAPA
jgi:PhnB protein